MNFDLMRRINLWFNLEGLENIIFESELMVASSKIDVAMVYNEYSRKLENKNKFASDELKKIARRLKANQNKYDVYEEYVDKVTLNLLKTAEAKGLSTSLVLQEYAPIRKLALKNKKSIKSALMVPLVLFVFITLILSNITSKFEVSAGTIDFSPLALFLMHYYSVINFGVFLGVVAAFFYFPNKVPVLSAIYNKLDSLLAISLSQTLLMAGMSAKDVIPMIRRQFNITDRKGKGDFEELVTILNDLKFLSVYEAADLELALQYGKFEEMLTEKKEKRFEETVRFGELVGEVVKNFSIVLLAIPLSQFVLIIMDLVTKATSMAGQ